MIRSEDINFEVKNTFEPPPLNAVGVGVPTLEILFFIVSHQIRLKKCEKYSGAGNHTLSRSSICKMLVNFQFYRKFTKISKLTIEEIIFTLK